jgi:negative regulator of flagellin synthesis FlgM
MKVTDTSEIKRFAPTTPSDTSRAGPAERTETEDRVSTDESAQVKVAVAEASRAAAGAHSSKLAAIAAAVKAGVYRPDPQRIAQEILDDAELAAKLQALFRG